MAFAHPTNLGQIGDLLNRLGEHLSAMRDNRTMFPIRPPEKDARMVGISNMYFMVAAQTLVIYWLSKLETGMMPPEVFAKLINLEKGDPRNAAERIHENVKLSTLTLFLFQAENLLCNLLPPLGYSGEVKGYYNICREVLDRATVTDKSTKLENLQIPAYIRNSSHSNGIHHDFRKKPKAGAPPLGPQEFKIQDVEFSFKDGERVMCAGWGHLYLACDLTASILEEILLSPEVQAIKGPIRDEFAWQNAGLT